jgi:hypothetical protein
MTHPMARQVVAAVVTAVLAAPLFAGFATEAGPRLCTTHACPHHTSPQPATTRSCHHAGAAATRELKCGCQGQEAARLVAMPLYLATPVGELAVLVESTAALALASTALTAGHRRLEPRPPRQRTFAL